MIRLSSLVLSVFLFVFGTASLAYADVIRGRVVDPQDKPAAGVQVLIVRGKTVVASTRTTADGQFGPLTVPAGDYDVLVAATGLRAPATRITVAATGTVEANVKLVLSAVSDAIVVSASQVDQPLSRVTDSVTIIDRADLDARQTETVTEVLRLVPGFSMIASGGRGALFSIFPRGGESDYTLFLVDGIPLNTFGGGFDGAHLSTAGVDRIEVVRGPQSAVFGSGAIGGVVNVITRKGGPPQAHVLAEIGQQGTSRLTASTHGGHGAWFWGASLERLVSDGDTSVRPSIGGPVSNDDYERIVGTAGLGWSDRATRQFRVDTRVGRDERGNPGAYGSDPFGRYFGLDTESRGINEPRGVSASAVLGDSRTIRHVAQFSWSDRPSNIFISGFGNSVDQTRRVMGRYQADMERGRAGFTVGVEIVKERADNSFVTGDLFLPIPIDRSIAGMFVESRWDVGTRGAVTAGARLDRIERAPLETDGFGRPTFGTHVVWSLNPKLSAAWFLRGDRTTDVTNGWTKIRGGVGTGIKPPTVFELAFTDNPSLKPERSRSFDAGIEHAFPSARLIADATVFANRYNDLIVSVGTGLTGASVFRTDNISNASARGAEFGVRWQSAFGLSARGAYTWLETEILAVDNIPDTAPSPYVVGDPLVRRPRHQGSLDLRYARGRAQLFLVINGRNTMTDLEPNFADVVLTNPGFVVYAAGGSFRISRQLEAYARITNLLDRDYEDALGFPAQARSASVGLRVAIGR